MTDPQGQMPIRIADEDLPVLSAVAAEARQMIRDGNSTPAELEALIRKDASLSSQILVLANSPVYGGRVKFSTITQAAVRLGTRALEKAILVAAAGNVFPKNDEFITQLWEHSVATAEAARWLSGHLKILDPEECFLAGIVHDVGKVMIYSQHPEEYRKFFDAASMRKIPFHQYERTRIAPTTHEWIGGMLGKKWGLSKPIVDAMRAHNLIEGDAECVDENREFVALVSLANLLCRKLGYSPEVEQKIDGTSVIPAYILGVEESVFNEAEEVLPALIDEQLMSFR